MGQMNSSIEGPSRWQRLGYKYQITFKKKLCREAYIVHCLNVQNCLINAFIHPSTLKLAQTASKLALVHRSLGALCAYSIDTVNTCI